MLKLAHITDTHIAAEGTEVNGVDTRDAFLRVLDDIREQNCDALVHGGDLAYPEGDRESYSWIKEQLDALDIPYVVVPGNHDDGALMQSVFNRTDRPSLAILTGATAIRGESLMFMDSSSARLPLDKRQWLLREMQMQDDELILFQHHPPRPCGVPFMDREYPYKTPELFAGMLKELGRPLTVFCGHYHVEKDLDFKDPDLSVYITAPTMGRIDPEADAFIMKDPRPGWREIRIDGQKLIATESRFLN